jgi:hypothetical protein
VVAPPVGVYESQIAANWFADNSRFWVASYRGNL